MLESLIVLLIVIVIITAIGYLLIGLIPDPRVKNVAYVILAVILLLMLLVWVRGGMASLLIIAPALHSVTRGAS